MTIKGKRSLTAILIIYAAIPILIGISVVYIGIVTGNLFLSNAFILIDSTVLLLLSIIFIAMWRARMATICAVSAISVASLFIFEEIIRVYFYETEIILSKDYGKYCIPGDAIIINGDVIRICRKYDFNYAGFVDLIVYIEGDRPGDVVLNEINNGNITHDAMDKLIRLGGIWKNGISYRRLLENYYLVKVNMAPT